MYAYSMLLCCSLAALTSATYLQACSHLALQLPQSLSVCGHAELLHVVRISAGFEMCHTVRPPFSALLYLSMLSKALVFSFCKQNREWYPEIVVWC